MGKYWRNIGQDAVIVNLKMCVCPATTGMEDGKGNNENVKHDLL